MLKKIPKSTTELSQKNPEINPANKVIEKDEYSEIKQLRREISDIDQNDTFANFFRDINLKQSTLVLSREANGAYIYRPYARFLLSHLRKKTQSQQNINTDQTSIRKKFIETKSILSQLCRKKIKKYYPFELNQKTDLKKLSDLNQKIYLQLMKLPLDAVTDIIRFEMDQIFQETKKLQEKTQLSPVALNQERENSFNQQIKEIKSNNLDFIKKSFTTCFPIIRFWTYGSEGRDSIFANIHIVSSELAKQLTGKKIERPVFIIKDINILNELIGDYNQESGGFYQPPVEKLKTSSTFYESGIIISRDQPTTIEHEILHSIDPLFRQRKGENKIIEEIFAYYPKMITKNQSNNKWQTLFTTLTDPMYNKKNLSENKDNVMVKTEYFQKIKDTLKHLQNLEKKYNNIDIMRLIGNSKTLKEILQFK